VRLNPLHVEACYCSTTRLCDALQELISAQAIDPCPAVCEPECSEHPAAVSCPVPGEISPQPQILFL
jgi:hypothetical protein